VLCVNFAAVVARAAQIRCNNDQLNTTAQHRVSDVKIK